MRLLRVWEDKKKRDGLLKFVGIVAVVVTYFSWVSYRFGAGVGLSISILTYSFFVLCTPVAAAGFLFDFPIRLVSHVRMLYTELAVWASALAINLIMFFMYPWVYQKTIFLGVFYHILSNPIPYWSIIILSGIGTFLSIILADEIMDASLVEKEFRHRLNWKRAIISVSIILLTVIFYEFLLHEMGFHIPLF